jgi:hypothetical protein
MEEKEFIVTMPHRAPILTSTEEIAYQQQRFQMTQDMIGKPFLDTDREQRGIISNVTLNEKGWMVITVKCDNDDYDILMKQLDTLNQRMKSFSVRGTSR